MNPTGNRMVTQSCKAMPCNRTIEMGTEIVQEPLSCLCIEERYPVQKAFICYNSPKYGGLRTPTEVVCTGSWVLPTVKAFLPSSRMRSLQSVFLVE